MAYMKLNQRGVSHVVALLFVLVVAVVGFGAYRVMTANKTDDTAAQTQTTATAVPDKFKTKADLQQASKALDETDVSQGVNPTQFDADINSML